MHPTPEHAAQQEFNQQQAAFERARQRLAAARQLAAPQHAPTPSVRNANAFEAFRVASLGVALLIALLTWWCLPFLWNGLETNEHRSVAIVLALLSVAGAVLLVVSLYVRRRMPVSSIQRVVMEFYRRVNIPAQQARLSELVADGNSNHPADRALPAALIAKIAYPVTGNPSLADYWRSLTQDSKGTANRFHFKPRNIRTRELNSDLCLATFDLLRPHEPSGRATLAMALLAGIAMGIAIAPLAIWLGSIASLLLLPLSLAAVFITNQQLERRAQKFKVRKLLLRCGNGWRLFSGEWEAHEEADLSWLETMPPQPQAQTPAPGASV